MLTGKKDEDIPIPTNESGVWQSFSLFAMNPTLTPILSWDLIFNPSILQYSCILGLSIKAVHLLRPTLVTVLSPREKISLSEEAATLERGSHFVMPVSNFFNPMQIESNRCELNAGYFASVSNKRDGDNSLYTSLFVQYGDSAVNLLCSEMQKKKVKWTEITSKCVKYLCKFLIY